MLVFLFGCIELALGSTLLFSPVSATSYLPGSQIPVILLLGLILLGSGTAHIHNSKTNPKANSSFMCETSAMLLGVIFASFMHPSFQTFRAPLALVLAPCVGTSAYSWYIAAAQVRAEKNKPEKSKL